jgi:16S rRNA (uracil1498-N3)-methyltransferase
MQLFYNSEINDAQKEFVFDKIESAHIVKVLRKKNNDIVHVTNGLGELFFCKIKIANERKCIVEISKIESHEPSSFYIHLAVAPTKMNDRFEWFLEKATEIGIHEITPILCENSERKIIKTERFDKILQSALKQSLSCFLPKLNQPMKYTDFIKQNQTNQLLIAHCDETSKKLLKNVIIPESKTTLLIGPEGDFSKKEIQFALDNNYIPVSLGTTRLRTETAAIVACHSIVFLNQN